VIIAQCTLSGDQFYPSKLIGQIPSDIQMDLVHDPAQIGANGRFKGTPFPYGYCRFLSPEKVNSPDRIEWMADFISKYIDLFRTAGANDIVLHLDWTGIQGNMEFTASQLKKIADLNIPLSVTYRYEESVV
jgi:hypothetical protein